MKKHFSLVCIICMFSNLLQAQPDSSFSVKIGGNYYINFKKIISFSGANVLSVSEGNSGPIKMNFDVYDKNGKIAAKVKNGVLTEGNKNNYELKNTGKDFTFREKGSGRIICYAKKVAATKKGERTQLWVWVDMYMPSGLYFTATPETTNIEMLNFMKGSTFAGAETAISLN